MSDTRLKYLLAALCCYEAAAILGAPWPTVTRIVHAHRDAGFRLRRWAARGGAVGFAAWTVWHLLFEDPDELIPARVTR